MRAVVSTELALVLLALCLALAGCTASTLQAHARAATVTAATLHAGVDAVTDARRSALSRVEHATQGQPVADRLTALRAERERWAPVGAALDAARSALLTWIDSVELAHAAGGDGELLGPVLRLAARVVRLYDDAARLGRQLGAHVPRLPQAVTELVDGIGGAS